MAMPDEEVLPDADPTEWVRVAVIAVMLLGNVAILYWQWRQADPSSEALLRQRMKTWWDRTWAAPRRKVRELRRAEGEVVYEAITVVEGAT